MPDLLTRDDGLKIETMDLTDIVTPSGKYRIMITSNVDMVHSNYRLRTIIPAPRAILGGAMADRDGVCYSWRCYG